MGWKNWPYWVKGGLISVSLPILSLVLLLVVIILLEFKRVGFFIYSFFVFNLFLITALLISFVSYVPNEIASMLGIHLFKKGFVGIYPTIPGAIFVGFIWFIAGAIIGEIIYCTIKYYKIKSKR